MHGVCESVLVLVILAFQLILFHLKFLISRLKNLFYLIQLIKTILTHTLQIFFWSFLHFSESTLSSLWSSSSSSSSSSSTSSRSSESELLRASLELSELDADWLSLLMETSGTLLRGFLRKSNVSRQQQPLCLHKQPLSATHPADMTD